MLLHLMLQKMKNITVKTASKPNFFFKVSKESKQSFGVRREALENEGILANPAFKRDALKCAP